MILMVIVLYYSHLIFPLKQISNIFFHTIGQAGWGIAWYNNETIVPELVVERRRTYTVLTYGGAVPASSSNIPSLLHY